MEDTQRQNLVTSFNNVLRTSALVGVVDLQRAAMAFSALVERTPDGANLALGPLYDFLLEQKAPEPAVREVLVFLKSREERFGLRMDLPPKLSKLSDEDRNKLVLAFTQRGASSGTQTGVGMRQPDAADNKAVVANKRPSSPGDPATNALVPAPEPKRRQVAASSMSTTQKLSIVVGVSALVLVANVVFNVVTAPPPLAKLVFDDPSGLPCSEAKGSGDTVICRVPKAFVDKTPEPAVDAKGSVTAAAARALGYKKVLVFSIEDSKMHWVF